MLRAAPHLSTDRLNGGFRYRDAGTDDARLVLRVLFEAERAGASACNYVAVEALLKRQGAIAGVVARDVVTGATVEVPSRAVINATGVWADFLRGEVGARPRMRPLRGSHLVFDAARVPAPEALTLMHPDDGRPLFILPWVGATVVGTTDVDHRGSLDEDASISPAETEYIFRALSSRLPGLELTTHDVVSSFSGVRPVVGTGKADPSHESRDHVVWDEEGLLTVTGGKLTTFRIVAHDALEALRSHFPVRSAMPDLVPVPPPDVPNGRRLAGRYGEAVHALLSEAGPAELTLVPGTPYLWAELAHAARAEAVVTLADLLLRRVRMGLLLRDGGAALLPRVRSLCQPLLGWSDERWEREEAAYRALRASAYALSVKEKAA
jgi:glycerol-3-phosphate dehydrogenase